MKRGFVSRFSKGAQNRIETLHVANLQNEPARRGELRQFGRMGGIFRDRFFDQEMFAPGQQFARDVEMRVRRGRDRGGVHLFRKLFEGSGGRDPEFIGQSMRSRLVRIVDRGELFAGKFRIKARVVFPNVPDADDAHAKRFHFGASGAAFCRNQS